MNHERLKGQLVVEEGVKSKPYPDSKDITTIGCGWNMNVHKLPPDIQEYLDAHGEITMEMVDKLLDISIDIATIDAQVLFKDFYHFSDRRQEALVDLVFNMGATKIRRLFPSFCAAIFRRDWQRAADELKYASGLTKEKLSGWYNDVKEHRAESIIAMIREG